MDLPVLDESPPGRQPIRTTVIPDSRMAEVVDRHAEADRFVKTWTSFDPLTAGELIAVRADGSELRAQEAGYIVFPDVSELPGHEWSYQAQRSLRPL